ncbi:hypothetical protein NMY22_g2229 [Coprinellus aureogranulatus]|nr:hypothetical protein NMY22_g2229 [Coprinellus aureogranulatus]
MIVTSTLSGLDEGVKDFQKELSRNGIDGLGLAPVLVLVPGGHAELLRKWVANAKRFHGALMNQSFWQSSYQSRTTHRPPDLNGRLSFATLTRASESD